MNIVIASNEKEYRDALSVRFRVFVEEQHVPEEEEVDAFEERATHFVAYDRGEPVGAGRCRRVEDRCKVERICVLPSHRKQGIGEAIMKAIEDFAASKQMLELKLNAQNRAESFYKRLGYETVSGEFLDAGIPHVAMVKTLKEKTIDV